MLLGIGIVLKDAVAEEDVQHRAGQEDAREVKLKDGWW
jgi:hypothetical protein